MLNLWIMKDIRLESFIESRIGLILTVLRNNDSNQPYHDINHLIGVSYLASQVIYTGEDYDAQFDLMTAGMLHDFCHAGLKPDSENISYTIKCIVETLDTDYDWRDDLIKETEYNFNNPLPDVSDLGKILRDADQLYSSYFFNEDILIGLYKEIGGDSIPKFIERNIEYVSNLPLYTDKAKEVNEKILPDVIGKHMELLAKYK